MCLVALGRPKHPQIESLPYKRPVSVKVVSPSSLCASYLMRETLWGSETPMCVSTEGHQQGGLAPQGHTISYFL